MPNGKVSLVLNSGEADALHKISKERDCSIESIILYALSREYRRFEVGCETCFRHKICTNQSGIHYNRRICNCNLYRRDESLKPDPRPF